MSQPRNNNLLIEHIIKADETEAEKMLQEGFSIFDIGEATDHIGRMFKGSAFELAAALNDLEMLKMMKPYLKNNQQQALDRLKVLALGEPSRISMLANEWLAELIQKRDKTELGAKAASFFPKKETEIKSVDNIDRDVTKKKPK